MSSSNTSNFLRSSIFDVASDLGLVDRGVTDWLDESDEKTVNPQRERIPNWPLSPPESDSSHLTHSGSSHGHYSPPSSNPLVNADVPRWPSVPYNPKNVYAQSPYAPRVGTSVALHDALAKAKAQNGNPTGGAPIFQYPSHFPQQSPPQPVVAAKPPPTRQPTKLTKKKAPRADSEYSFLQNEPGQPRTSMSRERSFFGRLRDRSRSKAASGKPSGEFIREEQEQPETENQNPDPNVVRSFSPPRRKGNPVLVERKESRRGRNAAPKPVQRIRVGESRAGAPQLFIENRQSADLLSSFAAELDAAGLSGSALTSTDTSTSTAQAYTYAGTNVMDRPHPKVRENSGFWANKDRDKASTAARIAAYRAGGPHSTKKGYRSSGSLKRTGNGVKRVGSGRRRAASSNTRRKPQTDSSRNSSTTRDDHAESDHSDFEDEVEKKEETIDEVAGESPVLPSYPPVPVPAIVERKPSVLRSAAANLPPLDIPRPMFDAMHQPTIADSLTPGNGGGATPKPSLDVPGSPGVMRRGTNPRRLSHLYSPSPLKPPTSPLPPTPGDASPAPNAVTPKRSESMGSGSSKSKSSFESARRAPLVKSSCESARRAPAPAPIIPTLPLRSLSRPIGQPNLTLPVDSSPNSPSSEYVVPSPGPLSPSDVAFPSSVVPAGSGVVPRGRMETTPEGRARAGSLNSGYFPESVVRKPATSAPSPIPERLGVLAPSASASDMRRRALTATSDARKPGLTPSASLSEVRRPPQLQLRGPSPARTVLQRTPTNPTPRVGLPEAPNQKRGPLGRSPSNLNVVVRPNRTAERIQSIHGEIGKFPSPVSANFPTTPTPEPTYPQPNLLVPPKIVARAVGMGEESDVSRSIYSTGEGWSDTDDDDRFALDVDELEETSRSFEVLAALLSAPSATKTALHRDMRSNPATPITPAAVSLSVTPAVSSPLPKMPPASPLSHSPSRKRSAMGAGGARWI